MNHPFVDGNKRVALTVVAIFLELNGHSLDTSEAVVIFGQLAAGDLTEEDLANWFKNSSILNDGIYAIITLMAVTIVIDTSVMISALIGQRGASRETLRKSLLGEYKPLISNALFQEYEDVSNRKRIINSCLLTKKETEELLKALYKVCQWVPIYYLWRPNIADEEDNFLIELALAGNATHIVTNNIRDFRNAELQFPSIRILTPSELLRGK